MARTGIRERRQIAVDVVFGDLVTAQQTLAGYITAYVTALGSQWQAVVDIANLLQTDIPAREVLPLAKLGSEMKLSDLHALTVDLPLVYQTYTSQGWWILVPNVERIHAAVRNLFAAPPVSDAARRPGGCI